MTGPLDLETLREWGRLYSNWGRWGAGDELGTLHFITPERVLAAASLPRSGAVISCALPFDAGVPGEAGSPHAPVHDGEGEPSPLPAPHGAGARWVALCHVSYDGLAYNERAVTQLPIHGARAGSIDRLASGVVGRGVLLDLPRAFGVPWLEDGQRIGPADLDACAEASGVTVETGDVLLVRTGRMTRAFAEGAWGGYAGGPSPGLSVRCARWLHERQIAAVATDSWCVEVIPHELDDCPMPLHQIAVRDIGLLFGESFHLDPLAEACAQDGRHAFLFVAAPLPSSAALGSPINPLAIK